MLNSPALTEIFTQGINAFFAENGLRDSFEEKLQKAILGEDSVYNSEGAFNLMTDLVKKLHVTSTFVITDNTVKTISEIIEELEVNEASGPLFLEYAAQ